MSNKPIVEIEVNSNQFRDFYEMFQKYAADLEEMPESWKKMGAETGSVGRSMGDVEKLSAGAREQMAMMAAQADAIGKAFSGALENHAKFTSALRESNAEMSKMTNAAKSLGSGAFGAVGHIAGGNGIAAIETSISTLGNLMGPLGKVAAIVAGIGTAALVAGKKLADDAIGDQREARGLGVSTGQLRSFDLNFGRYADSSLLNRAAGAQGDLGMMPYAMMATGQSWQKIQGEDAGQMSIQMLQRAHDWWNKTPAAMRSQQTLMATGLDKFMSWEEVRRAGAMTDPELSQAKTNYAKNISQFDVSGKSNDALFDFSRGLDEKTMRAKAGLQEGAGDAIKALEGLTTPAGAASGALGGLSDAATKLEKIFDGWTSKMGNWFGLGGDDASTPDKPGAGKGHADAPKGPAGPHPLGTITHDPNWTVKGEAKRLWEGAKTLWNWNADHQLSIGPAQSGNTTSIAERAADAISTPAHAAAINGGFGGVSISGSLKGTSSGNLAEAMNDFMGMGWTREQAAAIVANLNVESGLRTNIAGDHGKAYGVGQWHSDRQAEFKKMFGHDIHGSTLQEQYAFVDYELRHDPLYKKAGNALLKAGSAAEGGAIISRLYERPANVMAEQMKRGADAQQLYGMSSTGAASPQNLSSTLQRLASALETFNRNNGRGLHVSVSNPTSARVAMSTNAATVGS